MATGSVKRRVSKSGRITWQATWDVGSGTQRRQRSKSFPVPLGASRREEEAVRKQAERYAWQQLNGEPEVEPEARRMTVGELLERWLRGPAMGLEPATRFNYGHIINGHLLPTFGRTRLIDLRPLAIEDWLREKETRYSRNWCSAMMTVLRAALRQAVAWRLISFDPSAGIRLARKDTKAGRALSDREARRLLVTADHDTKSRGLWRILLIGGLRIGEAVALTWGDVVEDAGKEGVYVRRTESRTEDGNRVVKAGAKGGKVRFVPLDGETIRALGLKQLPGAYVFRGLHGKRLSQQAARERLQTLVKHAAIDPITPHDLRRSQVTLLRQAGVPAEVAAAIAGHTVEVANTSYRRVTDAEMRDAVTRLADRLKTEKTGGVG